MPGGQFDCSVEFHVEMDIWQDVQNYKLKMLPKILPSFGSAVKLAPRSVRSLTAFAEAGGSVHLRIWIQELQQHLTLNKISLCERKCLLKVSKESFYVGEQL